MDAESVQKTFSFTTANTVLMKLSIDIYLNKVFHLAISWGATNKAQEGIN